MKDASDLAVIFAIATAFLGWQLYNNHAQAQSLKETLNVCQQREARTDQMIDKLRGFNH